MKNTTKKKPMRAGVPGRSSKRSPTASQARVTRKSAVSVRRETERRPAPFEVWATMAPADRWSGGQPRVCLWGTQEDADEGRDTDERVVLVRVEVLEVLDA